MALQAFDILLSAPAKLSKPTLCLMHGFLVRIIEYYFLSFD